MARTAAIASRLSIHVRASSRFSAIDAVRFAHHIRRVLLVPVTIAVSQREADLAETADAHFAALGFEVVRSGVESISVRRVPTALADLNIEALVRDGLADLRQHGN